VAQIVSRCVFLVQIDRSCKQGVFYGTSRALVFLKDRAVLQNLIDLSTIDSVKMTVMPL
jgi:hypothetical protein